MPSGRRGAGTSAFVHGGPGPAEAVPEARRRRRWPRVLAAILAGATLAADLAGCAAERSRPGTTTTVILTRHADRTGESEELNETGVERARALVEAVRGLSVTAIYSPNSGRNVATVEPLSAALGIPITRTPQVTLFVAQAIAREILDKHAGGVVVFVGNVSGNLQAMNQLLGGSGTGPIEYGELHILTVPDEGPVTVDKRRYGP
jgi:hypothetical protein